MQSLVIPFQADISGAAVPLVFDFVAACLVFNGMLSSMDGMELIKASMLQVRLLFHGTSEQAIDNIINSDNAGFLPMLAVIVDQQCQ